MKTITLEVPDSLYATLRCDPADLGAALCLAAAMHWYSRGRLSQEMAATLASLDRADFLLALARERMDVFAVDLDALKAEIER